VPQKKRLRFMREFHSGELAGADRHRRGLRAACTSRRQPRVQLRPAAGRRDYVHRIGRTARAGAEGDAISFGCEEYAVALPDIEDYISHKIEVARVAPELLAQDLKPPVFKEWDPEDGPRPMHRGGGRGGPRRGGGGGGRGGPRRSSSGGGHRRGGR
jgi:ATP-dependent RNA helicase RhlB